MRATRYPELMERHRPENLEAVARLLPQGQGSAFDAEQAELARRLRDGGMGKEKLRVHMGASPGTLRRWLDPEGHAKSIEQKAERERLRRDASTEQRERRRMAALKAKGGATALAANHIQVAVTAVDEEWRTAQDRERRSALGAALDTLYKAKDKLMLAEGIR